MRVCLDSIEEVPSPWCYLLFVLNLLLPGISDSLRLGDDHHGTHGEGRRQRLLVTDRDRAIFTLLDFDLLAMVSGLGCTNHITRAR